MTPYWDPLPTLRRLLAGETLGHPSSARWDARNPLNVPGPIYGADTDTCLTGPLHAASIVACDLEGQEFVWRQPRTEAEVALVKEAAWEEVFGGYACDGDEHWTPDLVRQWWARRDEVRGAVRAAAAEYRSATGHHVYDLERQCLADYLSYFDDGLEQYLRHYLLWLTERRIAEPGERLPAL